MFFEVFKFLKNSKIKQTYRHIHISTYPHIYTYTHIGFKRIDMIVVLLSIKTWVADVGMTPRVLDINLPGSCQGRSPLEGYMKPARPSTLTWSRRQKLLVNPNWLHI
jgi:hypothetical protein